MTRLRSPIHARPDPAPSSPARMSGHAAFTPLTGATARVMAGSLDVREYSADGREVRICMRFDSDEIKSLAFGLFSRFGGRRDDAGDWIPILVLGPFCQRIQALGMVVSTDGVTVELPDPVGEDIP